MRVTYTSNTFAKITQSLVESLGNEVIDFNWNIWVDKGDVKC